MERSKAEVAPRNKSADVLGISTSTVLVLFDTSTSFLAVLVAYEALLFLGRGSVESSTLSIHYYFSRE